MTFSYHRAVAPMLWTLVAISIVEMAVVHALLMLWRPWVGLVASAISLAGIGWIVALARSLRHRPVMLDDERLVMRVGRLREIVVPLTMVAGLRPAWDAEWLKRGDVARLSLLAYPNIVVDLIGPVRPTRGRAITAIAHRLDEPERFAEALRQALARDHA